MSNGSDRERGASRTLDIPFLAKISSRGLLAVPAEVRELAQLAPGDIVEMVLVRVHRPDGSDPAA